jgi:hypothetical protein
MASSLKTLRYAPFYFHFWKNKPIRDKIGNQTLALLASLPQQNKGLFSFDNFARSFINSLH